MTNEEKLRHYAERVNLQDQDVDYILGLLREAKAAAYEEVALEADTRSERYFALAPRAENELSYRGAAVALRELAESARAWKRAAVPEPVSSVP